MTAKSHITAILLFSAFPCFSALQPMDDSDLEGVSGQIGIVLDGVEIIADRNANLQLSFDTSIEADGGSVDNLSLIGSGNDVAACNSWNANALPTFDSCNPISIGTFLNPITLDVGSDASTSFIELAFPGGVENSPSVDNEDISFDEAGWTSGIDLNFRLVVFGQGFDKDGSGDIDAIEANLTFADPVWIQARNIKLPGSSIRVWSNNRDLVTNNLINADGSGGLGASFAVKANVSIDEVNMDFANSRAYNTFTESYEAFAPNTDGDGPRSGTGFTGSDGSTRGLLKFTDVKIANLNLGVFPYLPLNFGSTNGDGVQPGFYVEIPALPNNSTIYDDYYNNVPKTDISIGGIQLGAGNNNNMGSATMDGLRIQHLRIELGS